MPRIHEIATLTSKGQITLPKSIRQALGVDAGGKLACDLQGNQVVLSRADEASNEDPAIASFLQLLEQDIATGKNISALPPELARSMVEAAKGAGASQDPVSLKYFALTDRY